MPRASRYLLPALLLLLVLGFFSVRRLDTPGTWFVVQSLVPGRPARLVSPGRHFLPPVLFRVTGYPSDAAEAKVELSGEEAAASREGSRVEVEVDLTYSIPAEGVLALHRSRGPAYEREWLLPLLARTTSKAFAGVSYDAIRDRSPELLAAIRAALSDAAGPDGIRVESIRLVPISALGESARDIVRPRVDVIPRNLIVVGVDSLDWRLVDPLVEQGRMPNVARLLARGARANLRTIHPILSPVIWTSIATGMKPSRHGIVDFVVTAADGSLIPVTSAMRRVPALWNLLGRQGVEVGVVAWWATWPAETVRGEMVTDRVAYQLFQPAGDDWSSDDPEARRGKTWPADLFDRIRPMIQPPADVTDAEIAAFLPSGRIPPGLDSERRSLLDDFRTVIAAGRTYHAIALDHLRRKPGGLKMFYYEGPDTASHLFMRYRPPRLDGVDPADVELFGGIVEKYYELQDRYIGELVDAAGPDATVILVSDHGFKSGPERPPRSDPRIGKGKAAQWHTPVGVLLMAGPDIRQGVDLGAASVLDIVPTVLASMGLPAARDMDGQPLTEAFDDEFAAGHRVTWIETYGGYRDPLGATAESGAGDPELLEKLRSLGYIGEERLTARNNRGVMALEEGDIDTAIEEFDAALGQAGAGATAMIRANLARAWLMKGGLEEARRIAQEALAADPGSKEALLILAAVDMKQERLDDAAGRLQEAIRIDPTFTQARTRLGEVYRRLGRPDEALEQLESVVKIAPLSPVEYNSIGNIHREQGRLSKAIEAYREALRADAQYVGAYNNLGLCLQEMDRLREAEALYRKALAIRPENPILRNSMGTLRALQGARESAADEFSRAAAADPGWPVPRGNLARILFGMGRFREALASFRTWVEMEPESVEARLGLALALLAQDKREEAIEQFGRVIERDPDNVRARIGIGETLLRRGDPESARIHLERAARLDPQVARVHRSLGETYMALGLRRDAARAFRKSLAIDPDQEAVRRLLDEAGG